MKSDLKKDLSVLTTINETTLDRLNNKVLWCISDVVEKTVIDREDKAEIDIGIGELLISISNNEIKYKFVPSRELEKVVSETVINERNDLVLNIEESLVSKMTNVIKDFF